jgi:hypothetical protein
LAVAVRMTESPILGAVLLAEILIVHPALAKVYVNSSEGLIALVPAGPVTVTSTVPPGVETLSAGANAVIDVAEVIVTPVAATPPKVTVSPEAKLVPVIVTAVPPPAAKITPTAVETPAGDSSQVGA